MNSRERVLRAFKILPGLPDRVPVQFDLSKRHLEHFSSKLGIPVRITDNLYEDVTWRISGNEIRTAMGSDVVITGASVSDDFQIIKDADGTWLNEYGMRMRQGQVYVEVVGYPLANAQTKADIDAYQFPDPYAPGRYRDAERLIGQYKKDYLVFGDVEVTIFSLAQQLVGLEKLLIDMMLEAEYVQPLFEKCTGFQTKVATELIRRGVDAIWYGDDFGTQNSLLMPPDIFVSQVKPWYKKMNDELKRLNPDVILILHSDGAVAPLLKDIKEMGFEIFNPVQPDVPGHSAKDIKDGFGDMFAFWGAIDQQHLLPCGTDEQLEADIKEKVGTLGANGGYMIAPAHIIQDDVSHERVETFIRLSKEHGAIQSSGADMNKLYESILGGKLEPAVEVTKEAVQEGADPQSIINSYMIPGMEEIGKRFEEGRAFVPNLLMSARAMKGCLDILKPLMANGDNASKGKILIGTVKGDLHDIGKNLVAAMLEGCGFEVINIGVDVPQEKFVTAIQENKPDILCMSALLTTTMGYMKDVVDAIVASGLRDRIKIMIGGAPLNESFARMIGADGYSSNANGAVVLAKSLMKV